LSRCGVEANWSAATGAIVNSLNTTMEATINYGRKTCFEAFKKTLAEFRGKENVTRVSINE
jgi:hypothetical protein